MKKISRWCALAALLLASLFADAMEWPSREGVLVSNFGRNDGGVPVLGNSFASLGPIYPSDVGELVFFHDPSSPASRFPSPLGSWMALDHGDNMVGIYGRYADLQEERIPTVVEKNTILAPAGISGWTDQEGFYFAFFDRRERRWINPSIIIAGLEDTRPPVIRQVALRSTAGTVYYPSQMRNIPQGLYTVYVDAADTIATGETLAPNRIICSLNGAETGMLSFETLTAKSGDRMVYRNGLVPASLVYDPRGFGLGELRLTRGQATLVIEALDIAGNTRSVTYRLNVE
ncbi:MAG: hypothetical protein LBD31_00160 [Treponema sp.]|jgi:hypothetical protein|nr:hypothetical protein [Treponema sp.]